jgi:hypothetical protein
LLTKPQPLPWIKRGLRLPALKPNAPVFAWCCNQRRQAKNCYVQHYYDCSMIWCLEGKGCKSEVLIRRNKKRLARIRSIGGKAGWRTRRKRLAHIHEGREP